MIEPSDDEKLVLGILSGTSADAVDIALIKIKGGEKLQLNVEKFDSYPINKELKDYLLLCSSKDKIQTDLICKLNFAVGNLFSDCILSFLHNYNIDASDIYCIGSHGQTIHHIPTIENFLNYNGRSTLQIGEPCLIAKKTGIDTVADFRTADIAIGGHGAPLVPYLDYILFKSENPRVLLNIGGIANLTYLKKDCEVEDVIAFDCGPGNMIIDSVSEALFNLEFDQNGEIASKGKVSEILFEYIKSLDDFINQPPPKSTGRELYGKEFVEQILNFSYDNNITPVDIIATVSEYTVYGITNGVSYVLKDTNEFEFLISGGGANNNYLIDRLGKEFSDAKFVCDFPGNVTAENKEAVLFGLLAYQTLKGVKNNIPSATGAIKNNLR